jgi:hypothetical protein
MPRIITPCDDGLPEQIQEEFSEASNATQQQLTRDDSPNGIEVLYLELLDALSARDPDEVRHAHKGEAPA